MGSSRQNESLRITDLSSIEPENFKFRNTAFLQAADQHYDNPHNRLLCNQREDIWRVRNGDIQAVLDAFPVDRPLPEQCAFWMRAFVGKHFFPDANHRTAIAVLRRLLRINGIENTPWPRKRVERVRDESHAVRKQIDPVRLDTLDETDELYEVWLLFFRDVLSYDVQ